MVESVLIAVFSDTHGNTRPMFETVRRIKPDAVLHLGDHARDAEALEAAFPQLDVRFVRGNCDLAAFAPDKLTPMWQGVRIFMTHGHLYNVKYTMQPLMNAAGFSEAQLVLYGHTHIPDWEEHDGVQFLNPGTAGSGSRLSYALIELRNGSFKTRLCPIDPDLCDPC